MNRKRFKKLAFTLAEVLIVVGIIGIIAQATIPTLINNVQDTQYKIAYKKAFSTLSQALNMANADYAIQPINGAYDSKTLDNFKTIMSYIKTQKNCYDGIDNSQCWYKDGEEFNSASFSNGWPALYDMAVIDVSGMSWATFAGGFTSAVFVDTNGFKKPNQWGKDRFLINLEAQNGSTQLGIMTKVVPDDENNSWACKYNKCATENNYYANSWLSN